MPRAMDGIWHVGTERLNVPALCLSVAVCACRCLSVSPLSTLVCLCLPVAVLLFLWLPWSVFVCRCLSLPVSLFADNFTPPLSPILLSPRSLSRAQAHRNPPVLAVHVHIFVCVCVCARARVPRPCVCACVRCAWPVGAGRGYATNIFQHLAACTALKPHTRMSVHPLVKFRQRIGRPEESWCPWQTEGRPACFCGSRCRSFAAGTCVHASQPQKAPPQDRRIARVR